MSFLQQIHSFYDAHFFSLWYFELKNDNIIVFGVFFLTGLSVLFRDGRQGNKVGNIVAGNNLRETVKYSAGSAGREDS